MEPEFVDPGPDQPWPPPFRAAPAPAPAVPPATGRREVTGLLIMLVAATLLPLLAATQSLYSATELTVVARNDFSVDAWGNVVPPTGALPLAHAPRFGLLLVAAAAGFAVVALAATGALLGRRATRRATAAAAVAGAATGLVGLLVGTVAGMTLEIQSAFDTYRSGFAGPVEVRMRIGGALWLTLAAILAGGLSVTAAVRVRRAVGTAGSGY